MFAKIMSIDRQKNIFLMQGGDRSVNLAPGSEGMEAYCTVNDQEGLPQGGRDSHASFASQAIGETVSSRRRELKLSAVELASQAGVSIGILRQIEQGKANPSLHTLERVASGLDIRLWDLLNLAEETVSGDKLKLAVTEKNRSPLQLDEYGLSKNCLSRAGGNSELHLSTITLPAHSQTRTVMIGPGEKAGLVLEGQILLTVDDEKVSLYQGDSFLFSSRYQHTINNDSEARAVVLVVSAIKGINVAI